MAAVIGAEVPGAGILLWVLPEGGAKLQITAEGFQDMLPGTYRMGAADADGLPAAEGADAVGNEAVCAPVATADDVARPCGGGAEPGTARLRKEGRNYSAPLNSLVYLLPPPLNKSQAFF